MEATPITYLPANVEGSAREQVAYMVDMAKADALNLLGESRQALELMDRHGRLTPTITPESTTFSKP